MRVTDYDRIADRFDLRYSVYPYDGVRETLLNFLGPEPHAILEVGCGTGHWLAIVSEARPEPSPYGIDPSAPMLARAAIVARRLRPRVSAAARRVPRLCRGAMPASIASTASTPSIISPIARRSLRRRAACSNPAAAC